jgi:hypothetical protein
LQRFNNIDPNVVSTLDHQDIEAVMPRGDRSRQAGTAGTDYQRITFVRFLFAARHVIPRDLFF